MLTDNFQRECEGFGADIKQESGGGEGAVVDGGGLLELEARASRQCSRRLSRRRPPTFTAEPFPCVATFGLTCREFLPGIEEIYQMYLFLREV